MSLATGSAQAARVYYNNPNNWSTVKAYVYKGSSKNAEWNDAPEMTKDGNFYYYDVPTNLEGGMILFHNGAGSQYPASGGFEVTSNNSMVMQDKTDDNKTVSGELTTAAATVYFDNSSTNWATPYFYYFGLTNNEPWPGTAMTQKEGSTTMYQATVPAGTLALVFNDGGTNQSGNLVAVDSHVYDTTGDKGTLASQDPFYVYWDNSGKNWTAPRVHYFGGSTESTWPGVEMTVDNDTGLYKYEVAAGTTGLVFNDGNGNQCADMTAAANTVYNESGVECLYSEYSTPETPAVTVPETLYVLGTFADTKWDPSAGVVMTKNGNKFTAENVKIVGYAADANGAFSLAVTTGDDWNAVNGANRYGAATDGVTLTSGVAADMTLWETGVNASACKAWNVPVGTYTIEADFDAMTIKVTKAAGPVAGNGSLAMADVTVNPGKDGVLTVNITTDKQMVAVQMDIAMPEQVTAGTPLISRTMGNHTMETQVQENGDIRVVIYSSSNETFSANNGSLLTIPFTVKAETAVGEYTATLKNIVFSDADLLSVTPANVTANINVVAVSVESVTLNKSVLALSPGATETLVATVLPEDAPDNTVTWTTDNASVATVSDAGLVTAVAKGTAVITASCNDVSATCTVYVGKDSQTITWNQVVDPLQVGGSVTFSATASSKLDVTYVITSGASLATINGNVLKATGAGVVTVEARQEGNENFAPAEPVAKTITIGLNYILGDADGNEELTLADATTTVSKILGNEPTNFNQTAADMNGDGVIDVVDVTLIIHKLLDLNVVSHVANGIAPYYSEDLEQFSIVPEGYSMRVSFSNMENYVATMFDLTMPEDITITNIIMSGSSHDVAYRSCGDNVTRVIAISMTNNNFAKDGYITIFTNKSIDGVVSLGNAVVNSTDGGDIVESPARGTSTMPSAIATLGADSDSNCQVYNVDGTLVYDGQASGFNGQGLKGIYVVRTAGKTAKVVLR